MKDIQNNLIQVAIAVILILVMFIAFSGKGKTVDSDIVIGAIGTNPVENYIPIIKLNDGYFSALAITTTGNLTAAAGSFSSTLSVTGAVTLSGVATLATTTTESLTIGGDRCTLTDANGGAFSLTQELLNRCSYFEFASGGAGQEVIQLTPVATSSLTTFIPNAGDCKSFVYDSSALVAATTTTMTATAGHILIAPTANDDLIDGAEYSDMKFCRRGDTDITWILSAELVDAD